MGSLSPPARITEQIPSNPLKALAAHWELSLVRLIISHVQRLMALVDRHQITQPNA